MVAFIIAEYNPFHSGHLYQIRKVRESFGEDTAVCIIMSGNYTQRGECAIADKFVRAKAAVLCGADLVLELPFPFSCAAAPIFAGAGVSIADRLGIGDLLVFGSECGSVPELRAFSDGMDTPEFEQALREIMERCPEAGYPKQLSLAWEIRYGRKPDDSLFSPNNLLAFEYIRHLKKCGSSLSPFTVQRVGADHKDELLGRTSFDSAAAIRSAALQNRSCALDSLPSPAKTVFSEAFAGGEAPCSCEKLSSAILTYFRCNPTARSVFHDAGGGLYNRLAAKAREASDLTSLLQLTETKKYTNARIRRAILFSLFGVTSSEAKRMPEYTQVLAFNRVGRSLLRRAKMNGSVGILTKPSDVRKLSGVALLQKQRCDLADSVFQLTKPVASPGNSEMKISPFFLDKD